jgi:hypothetical protein
MAALWSSDPYYTYILLPEFGEIRDDLRDKYLYDRETLVDEEVYYYRVGKGKLLWSLDAIWM